MAGRTNDFYSSFKRCMIRFCTNERREERVVYVDDAVGICFNHLFGNHLHIAWKVNERDNNVWIIHALAVRYEYRGMGLATQFVKNLISYAKLENIEAIHLDVIDKNTLADKLYIRAGFKYVSTENIFYEVVGNRQFRMYEYVIE